LLFAPFRSGIQQEVGALGTGSGFKVLIVRDDGGAVRRLSVPRWLVRAAVSLGALAVVGNVGLVAGYMSLRHDQEYGVAVIEQRVVPLDQAAQSEGAGAPETPPAGPGPLATTRNELAEARAQLAAAREQLAEKARILEPLERRLAEVRQEVRGWDGLHDAVVKPLSGERRTRAASVGERVRSKVEGTALEAVNSLLAHVREETHRLRTLARVTREAASIIASVPSRAPMRTAINSGFGMRQDPFTRSPQFHAGIDFAAPTGTPVTAAAGGIVRVAGTAAGYGNTVLLDHGRGFETRYGHLHAIRVAQGQRVERGQPIGLSGNTGRSSGPHLHYEVLMDGRPIDPRRLLRD
jgi:murein DD-endopeptidase MepM/ murein hydrolase activator NlpD